MAVEDHPKYEQWRKALEDLIEAQAQHKAAENRSPAEAAVAMRRLHEALAAYHAVAIAIVDG